MSIFGKLRRAKQAANEQKGKNAASGQSKPESVPYKHVPTHAATDALLGAPATWREQDKKAIQAQNQRRSQYHLSRNPSALSNVTTLNRDQSFSSTGFANAAAEKRKHYSMDWASTTSNGPRTSVNAPIARPTATHRSRHSLPPSPERDSYMHVDRRRSRVEMPESAPRPPPAMEQSIIPPQPSLPSHSKDVKFYLPSSRDVSPGPSSENSNTSSRDSSYYEPALPARHPKRRPTLETPHRGSGDHSKFQQFYKSPTRRVAESPTLPAVPSMLDPLPSPRHNAPIENDLSFIDFGRSSDHMDFAVAAH